MLDHVWFQTHETTTQSISFAFHLKCNAEQDCCLNALMSASSLFVPKGRLPAKLGIIPINTEIVFCFDEQTVALA